MGETSWARTEAVVRAALDAGDPAGLVPLLAPAVRWHAGGPGGCHTREHVSAWIDGLVASGATFRLRALRRTADRIVLRLAGRPGRPSDCGRCAGRPTASCCAWPANPGSTSGTSSSPSTGTGASP